jgi:membrane-associated phospholipid phosphatase
MGSNDILRRVRSQWARKLAISAGLIAAFGVLYVLPQRYPRFAVTALQPTRLDRVIPLMPQAVWLYDSLYLLMPIGPWLLRTRAALNRYTKGFLLMTTVASLFFVFWPTSVTRPSEAPDGNFLYASLLWLDNGRNAFPSLHAAYALFHAACCHVVFRRGTWHNVWRTLFWTWALAIAASTLLIKQHVAMDVVAGIGLALASFAICCRHIDNYESEPTP